MIKAVLFDLDGTLLNRDASVDQFVRAQYSRYEALWGVPEEVYVRSFVEIDAGGHVWKDEVYQQLIASYNIEHLTWQALLRDYVDNFVQACVGFAGLREMLEVLRAEGYVMGIVTNGRSPFQEGNIRALGIEDFFSVIVVSEAVGLRKPDAAIFNAALDLLNVQPHEAVFIGDNPDADIVGAQAAGLKGIWKRSQRWSGCEDADAVCQHLMELPEMIRQMSLV